MHFEIAFVMLFSVATAVALLARYFKVPYTVALVVAGLILGSTHLFEAPHLTKELLYAVFLPGLLFEAAFHFEFHKFWQNKVAIHSLAIAGPVPAILLTAAILAPVATALHFVEGFTFIHGLVFAAMIASTDPIAVVGLFKSVGAPKRLAALVEGESLLNDGTAVVLFTLVLAVAGGTYLSVASGVFSFIKVVGMGLVIGLAIGFAVSKVIHEVEDPMIEITLTTIAGYGSFIAAESFHFSGVIATVVAGMLCGNYAARTGMGPTTRIAVESFWEYLAFALNSIVFLLIGFEVKVAHMLSAWKPILLAFLAVLIGRAVTIFVITALLRRTREALPWSWAAVLTWGGLRGGLSMVLALGLAADFPHRELLINMTFGVVVLSILIQGLTMAPLLRRLGLVGSKQDRELYELERGVTRATTAALEELSQMAREKVVHPDVATMLREEYQQRQAEAEQRIRDLHLQAAELRAEEILAARRHLYMAEKDAIMHAYHKGFIGQDPYERLIGDIDARLIRLEEGEDCSGEEVAGPGDENPRRPAESGA